MTNAHWQHITAHLLALELLALSIAKAAPNRSAIRAQLAQDAETQATAQLHSGLEDAQIEAVQRRLAQYQHLLAD